jgi:hypothetical protein
MKADLDRFSRALEPVSADQMVFIYIPGVDTTFVINGKLNHRGPVFVCMLLSVCPGPKPPHADLKKGILGN